MSSGFSNLSCSKVKVSSLWSNWWQHAVTPHGILLISLEFLWSSVNYMGSAFLENLAVSIGRSKSVSLCNWSRFFFFIFLIFNSKPEGWQLVVFSVSLFYIYIGIPYCTQICKMFCRYESFCREEKACLSYFFSIVSNCHFCRTPLFLIH